MHQKDEDPVAVLVWDLDRGKVMSRLTLPKWAYVLHLLPDGKTLLAASFTGMMFGTWDVATGRRLSPDAGHESHVHHLAFTPDGTILLTASSDPAERVTAWDAATGRKAPGAGRAARAGAFTERPGVPFVWTPGGAVVTTGKGVMVWTDLKTGRELRRVNPKSIATAMDPGTGSDWSGCR